MKLPFRRLVHADWSANPPKRCLAAAHATDAGWSVDLPKPVGDLGDFVSSLVAPPQPTLAGFDFPLGLPAVFGQRTGFRDFPEALDTFGEAEWARFYDLADAPAEISLHRPFYPRVGSGARHEHLVRALDLPDMNALRRECERRASTRRAACPLFWTVGGNQVGRAAISGWREVVRPALRSGALLWPFGGSLPALFEAGTLVLCETYPAEAYGHVGVRFGARESKRRQDDRRTVTLGLAARCESRGIRLAADLRERLDDGFGPRSEAEDAFDALIGVLGMIEVVEGRRAAAPSLIPSPAWEGWILGQVG